MIHDEMLYSYYNINIIGIALQLQIRHAQCIDDHGGWLHVAARQIE